MMTRKPIRGSLLAGAIFALTACSVPAELAALAEPETYVDPAVATDPQLAEYATTVIDQSWSTMPGKLRVEACQLLERAPAQHEREFRRAFRSGASVAVVSDAQLEAVVAEWVAHLRRVC